jgi:hypothetical protein
MDWAILVSLCVTESVFITLAVLGPVWGKGVR